MTMLNRFAKQDRGALAVFFAIILPFIFSLCAIAFDGSRLLTKKARLADALNEAALAIATASSPEPDAVEKAKLKTLLNHYLDAYLPSEEVSYSDIIIGSFTDPETGGSFPVFDIRATVKVNTMLPFDIVPAFDPALQMVNQGKVRKGGMDAGRPADYVFVLDFSNSMNDPSAQAGKTRIELLKDVVDKITKDALEASPDTTFSLVPFDNGVLSRYAGQNALKTNELDGAVNGCSMMMVPRKLEHPNIKDLVDPSQPMQIGYDIDFDFWANKYTALQGLPKVTDASTSLPYTLDEVNLRLDKARMSYYQNYVLPSVKRSLNPSATMDTLVDMGWCEKTGLPNRAEYSCEKDPAKSIFTPANQEKIMREMERARRYAEYSEYYNSYNPLNVFSIDVEATLDGMFDENNVITFPLMAWRTNSFGTSSYMCHSAAVSDGLYNDLADVVPNAYLIEQTSDLNAIKKFQDMEPLGNTYSSSGLLRAVPEMVKGNNPRTVMIIISDGDDNSGAKPMLDLLHKDRLPGERICDRIRSDLPKHKPVTEDVGIYFISVVDGAKDRERTQYWADYCTGAENAVIATDYDAIMEKLIEIMSQSEETGYFFN